MSRGGSAEPRSHAGGGSPRQRGVFLPLGLVPVHVPGELLYPAFLFPSQIAAVVSLLLLAMCFHCRWARYSSTSSGEQGFVHL